MIHWVHFHARAFFTPSANCESKRVFREMNRLHFEDVFHAFRYVRHLPLVTWTSWLWVVSFVNVAARSVNPSVLKTLGKLVPENITISVGNCHAQFLITLHQVSVVQVPVPIATGDLNLSFSYRKWSSRFHPIRLERGSGFAPSEACRGGICI